MNTAAERRFAGRLTDEYRLVALAYPHIEEFQEKVASIVHAHLQSKTEGSVIEIGCGDGITTDLLLHNLGQHQLVSIDNEPRMVELARTGLSLVYAGRKILVERADALSYLKALPSSSVDVIVSVWTFHNFLTEYRSNVLAEVVRALRPGGIFVNGDKYAQEPPQHAAALNQQLKRFFDAYVPLGKFDFLREFVLHNVADESPERIMTEVQGKQELDSLGCECEVAYRNGMEAIVVAIKK